MKLRKRLKKVYGVGINDADYRVHEFEYERGQDGNLRISKRLWTCPFYSTWREMLRRCHSPAFKKKQTGYENVTVCEEWLLFSNFKEWMESQSWEGRQLDKDLLVEGNKVYGPDTCVFIPSELNQFFKERANDRGDYLLGVTVKKSSLGYYAKCSDPFTGKRVSLGRHSTEQEAHLAWKRYKNILANKYADILEEEGYEPRIIVALRSRYSSEKLINGVK